MSHFSVSNGATSGLATVTVSGDNFAALDPTPTMQIAMSMCSTVSWTSVTTVKCRAMTGSGADLKVTITVHDAKMEISNQYNFDMPVITSYDEPNFPTSDGMTMTVQGLNFGVSDPTPSQFIGATHCSTTHWVSITSALCYPKLGSQIAFDLLLLTPCMFFWVVAAMINCSVTCVQALAVLLLQKSSSTISKTSGTSHTMHLLCVSPVLQTLQWVHSTDRSQ